MWAIGLLGVLALSTVGAALIATSDLLIALEPMAPLAVAGLCLLTFLAAIFAGAVASLASSDMPTSSRSLLYLPVPTRRLALALSAPGMAVSYVLLSLAHPPLAAIVVHLSGYGWAHALVTLVLATTTGMLLGKVVTALMRILCRRSSLLSANLVTIVMLACSGLAGFAVLHVRGEAFDGTLHVVEGLDPLSGVSLLMAFAVNPDVGTAVVLVCVPALLAVAVVALAGFESELGISAQPAARSRVTWGTEGRMFLTRLALRRLVRQPRVRSWIVTDALMLMGISAWVSLSDSPSDVLSNASLIIALLSAMPCLFGRGLDDIRRPHLSVLGIGAVSYSVSWQLAGLLAAILVALPPMVFLGVTAVALDVVASCLCLTIAATNVASAYSFLAAPRPGDGSSEVVGGSIVLLVLVGLGQAASKGLGVDGLLVVSLVALVATLPLTVVPSLIEKRRWSQGPAVVSSPEHVLPAFV